MIKGLPRKGLTVLFYRSQADSSVWVAHCLDLDLVSTGKNADEAADHLESMLRSHIRSLWRLGDEAAPIVPAPKAYWEAAKEATRIPGRDVSHIFEELEKEPREARRLPHTVSFWLLDKPLLVPQST